MAFEEVQAALFNVLQDLPEKRLQLTGIAAKDVIGLVTLRIIETGVDAEGNDLRSPSGSVYSEAKVPYWFFKNKPSNRNAEQQAEQMKNKVGYFASYTDWRVQHDLPVDHVTLSFTGEMWKSIVANVTTHTDFVTTYEISASNEENQKKLGYLTALYDISPLATNEDEEEFLRVSNNERIVQCFRDRGFDLSN